MRSRVPICTPRHRTLSGTPGGAGHHAWKGSGGATSVPRLSWTHGMDSARSRHRRVGHLHRRNPAAGTITETALAKARLGMAAASATIGIASEGSYGPHPHMPFVAAGIEVMVLIDDERGIVVREQLIDEAPMFDHMIVNDAGGDRPVSQPYRLSRPCRYRPAASAG